MKNQPLDFEKPIVELEEKLADLKAHSREHDVDMEAEVQRMEAKVEEMAKGQGGMRVLVKWRFPAWELLDLTPKLHYLGLGVTTNLWHDFFMGADLVFRHGATAPN